MRASLLALALPSLASAQVHVAWTTTHPTTSVNGEVPMDVATSPSGRIAMTARSFNPFAPFFPPPPAASDVETAVFDASGTKLWSQRFGTPFVATDFYNDTGHACAFDAADAVYVVGEAQVQTGSRWLVLKYDAAGSLAWSRTSTLASTPGTGLSSVVVAGAAVYVAGAATGNDGTADVFVASIDPASGASLWETTIAGTVVVDDRALALAVGAGGDLWITGYVTDPATGRDVLVARIDPTGVVQWSTTIDVGGGSGDQPSALAVDGTGNAYVAGTASWSASDQDYLVAAFDPSGATSWVRTYDGTNPASNSIDAAHAIGIDPLGRIVSCGSLRNLVTSDDAVAFVHDAAGNVLHTTAFDLGNFSQVLTDLAIDAIGDVTFVGRSAVASGPPDLLALHYDPSGALVWQHVSGGSAFDAAVAPLGDAALAVTIGLDPGDPANVSKLVRLDRTAVPFCFGDGSASACPCGNASAPGAQVGCLSSFGTGARLRGTGSTRISADSFVLAANDMPPTASCLYFQGTTQLSGTAFGDGLRCAGGTITRIGSKTNVGGASQYPQAGDASVHVRGGVVAPGQRTYQAWYRNLASFCTSDAFNLSNGLLVTWEP